MKARQRREMARCHAWFAVFLEDNRYFDASEREYRACLEIEPSNPLALGNFALFVHKVRRDRVQALSLFERAVKEHPSHVAILIKFAGVRKACGDLDGAQELYQRASQLEGPTNGDARGAYAVFLHSVRSDSAVQAEAMYASAAEADPLHANNLSNFGLFLSDVKGDLASAELRYLQALGADPLHANACYNYAVLLDSSLGKPVEAKAMYRRVLEADPKHAYALYNLAVLLEEGLNSSSAAAVTAAAVEAVVEVRTLYERAVVAAPKDSVSAADLGRFLLVRVKDPAAASPYLKKALELDPRNAVALYNTGLLHTDGAGHDGVNGPGRSSSSSSNAAAPSSGVVSDARTFPRDVSAATKAWRFLVDEVDPLHVNGLRRLARLEAVERKDFDQADERFAQALKATLRLSSSSSSAPPVEHGGGSKAAKSKGGMSAGECLAAAPRL